MNKFRYINYKKAKWMLKPTLFIIKYDTIDNEIQKHLLVFKERESKKYVAKITIYSESPWFKYFNYEKYIKMYGDNDNKKNYRISCRTLKYFNSRAKAIRFYVKFLNNIENETTKYKNIISYYFCQKGAKYHIISSSEKYW